MDFVRISGKSGFCEHVCETPGRKTVSDGTEFLREALCILVCLF